ncbi:serine hydrolase [Streptomyces sp. NBC_01310]|uniref:D-alanyl-D-alanine carboxypeptidase family protein n=1 Tax=Streptomyces sp. NBC_01310 TaxID=2903820 RepID=UPI0035B597F7|nr:serine hydrolase [Streptomyces sp. NBC_01310]
MGEADARGGAKAGGGARPEAEAKSEAEAEANDEAATGVGAEGEADARAGAGTGARAGTEGGARPEAGPAVKAETEARTSAGSKPRGGAHPAAELAADAAAKAEAGTRAGDGTRADAKAGSGARPDAAAKAEAEAGAMAGSNAATVGGARPETGLTADTAAKTGARAGGGARPAADAAAKPQAGTGDGTGAKAGAGGGARPETGLTADTVTKPQAGTGDGTGAQTGAGGGARPDAGLTADTVTKAKAKAKTGTGTGARPAAELAADTAAKDKAGDGDGTGAGAKAGGGARPDAELVDDAVAKAGDGTSAGDNGRGGAGAGSEAGAGGKGPGKGRAGDAPAVGERGAGAEDTQVLRTRDVPSWARDNDAERTSQFVALKDLDVPPPPPEVKPARQAPAPPAPPAQRAPAPPARQAPAPLAPPAPLPPLDLLAELTNTASPQETPRRTALRRVKVWTPILLLLVGASAGAQLLRPLPAPHIVASQTGDHTIEGQFSIPWPAKGQGAVRVSGSGDIGTFGEQKPVPTASVAKVMTAYVILKSHPLRKTDPGPDITVDAKTVADGNSTSESRIVGLTAGTKFSQQDMLKMLMIPSGNNVARLLARWDTGSDSEAAFVEKMNAAARELGMTDTTYTDPSGLDAGTVSTATDQLKLAEAVMKDEAFRAIVALPSATIKGLPQRIENNNDLLTVQGLSIRGIKTGSSTPAGGALMWAAYKSVGDETPLILGTLMEQRVEGPDPDAMNSLKLVKANSKKIIEAVRTALASAPVIRKGETVGYVDDGLGGRTPLVATKDLNVIGVPGQRLKLSLTAGASPLPHTAKAGSEVAVLTVGEGEAAKSVPVAVQGNLAEPSFGTRLTRLR